VRTEGGATTAHTLDEALERLRKNHYHLWKPLIEAREDPTRLEEWRRAPRGSQEWRKARHLDAALRVLSASIND
jgi:hypothetical protein